MAKSPDAFRTIREVADWLDTPAHVLRFWEGRFTQIRPVKRAGGRRYYRPSDMALLAGIKKLLHEDGMTIRGVQKILHRDGVRHVAALAAEREGGGGPYDAAPDAAHSDGIAPASPASATRGSLREPAAPYTAGRAEDGAGENGEKWPAEEPAPADPIAVTRPPPARVLREARTEGRIAESAASSTFTSLAGRLADLRAGWRTGPFAEDTEPPRAGLGG